MALSDVAGVFSRYFIVGFFLPAFSGLVIYSVTVSADLLPNLYERYGAGTQIAILGGTALLLGLFLLGLNYPIMRGFEGYPLRRLVQSLEARKGPVWQRVAASVRTAHDWLVANQRDRWDALRELRDHSSDPEQQGRAAWQLDRCFPGKRGQLLPTSLGNAVRAFELHSSWRWGLDAVAVYPRIAALLSEKEHEIQADAKADLAFLLNLSLLTSALALAWLLDAALGHAVAWYATPAYVLPFAVSYGLYRAAIGAAQRWGSTVRSAFDLHRLDLYEKIGVRQPKSFREERTVIGPAVSRCFLHGNRLPDDLRAPPEAVEPHKEGEDD